MRVGVWIERWEREVVSQGEVPMWAKLGGLVWSIDSRIEGGGGAGRGVLCVSDDFGFMRDIVEVVLRVG